MIRDPTRVVSLRLTVSGRATAAALLQPRWMQELQCRSRVVNGFTKPTLRPLLHEFQVLAAKEVRHLIQSNL
jgi:hypothetical protein